MRTLIASLVDENCWANRRRFGTVEALPADAVTRKLGREVSLATLPGMIRHVVNRGMHHRSQGTTMLTGG